MLNPEFHFFSLNYHSRDMFYGRAWSGWSTIEYKRDIKTRRTRATESSVWQSVAVESWIFFFIFLFSLTLFCRTRVKLVNSQRVDNCDDDWCWSTGFVPSQTHFSSSQWHFDRKWRFYKLFMFICASLVAFAIVTASTWAWIWAKRIQNFFLRLARRSEISH